MAQNIIKEQNFTAISQNSDIDVTDVNILSVSIKGTFVATASFFVSDDGGTTWFPLLMTPANSATGATSATALGLFKADVTPYNRFRVGTTAYTSGTVVSRIVAHTVQD